jgi:hypothetical protein
MANKLDLFMSHSGLAEDLNRYLVQGVIPAAPTTPSTQGAGIGGACTIRVFEGAGLLHLPSIDGLDTGRTVQSDAIDDVVKVNAVVGYLLLGQERRFDVVGVEDLAGQIRKQTVHADAAVDGLGQWPTAAQIQTAIGSVRVPWMRLYGVRVRRLADAVLTITYDYTRRPLGVTRPGGVQHTSEL